MKYDNTRAFVKHLQNSAPNHLSSLYLVMTKDDYDRKEASDALIKFLKGQGEVGVNVYRGEKLQISLLLEDLFSYNFFSKKRVVAIYDAENLSSSALQHIQKYVEKPSPDVFLILISTGINRGTTFYKQMEKEGIILDIPEEKSWVKEKSVTDKVMQKLASEGKQIDPQACKLLLQQLGTDQTLIFNEIEKLICYTMGRNTITVQDVGAICCSVNIDNAWQLGEAIFKRDAGSALKISQSLLEDEGLLLPLLRQIRYQFQTQYQVSCILRRGGGSQDVQNQYKHMSGKILQKNIELSQGYGHDKLREGIVHIDEAELTVKNSMTNPGMLLERLIIKLTTFR